MKNNIFLQLNLKYLLSFVIFFLAACGTSSNSPKEDEFVTINADSSKILLPYLPEAKPFSNGLKKYAKALCESKNDGNIQNILLKFHLSADGKVGGSIYVYNKAENSALNSALNAHNAPISDELISSLENGTYNVYSDTRFPNAIRKLNSRTILTIIELYRGHWYGYYNDTLFCSIDTKSGRD